MVSLAVEFFEDGIGLGARFVCLQVFPIVSTMTFDGAFSEPRTVVVEEACDEAASCGFEDAAAQPNLTEYLTSKNDVDTQAR